jgi:hypothetical protein
VIVVVVLESGLNATLRQITSHPLAPASLVSQIVNIPLSGRATVKAGEDTNPMVNIPASYKATALTLDGLPEIGFVGAEYCPYCALQRWSIIIGLSPFGTWSGLHVVRSSVYDSPANVPTFTFAYGAKFKSKYVAFYARELQNNVSPSKTGPPYQTLQSLTNPLGTAFTSIDANQGYPFLDYGGKLAQVGSEASVANVDDLQNLSWSQVAAALSNHNSTIAKDILGGANYVTAATCVLTNDQPASACSNTNIQALITKIKASA